MQAGWVFTCLQQLVELWLIPWLAITILSSWIREVGVVAADLRSVMTARGQNLPDLLVARRGPGRSMPDEDIESVLGVRPDMTIKDDRRLARGQGDGEAPWVVASRRWRSGCAELVDQVMGS